MLRMRSNLTGGSSGIGYELALICARPSAAMTFSSVSVIANALRLRRVSL
jgi:cation transport ATPase